MSRSEHLRRLEAMYRSAPINRLFPSDIEVGPGWARITAEISEAHFHAAGAAHGAAYFKLLDDASFYAVSTKVEEVFMLTTAFNVHLTRPLSAGPVRAEARWLHGHRRIFLAESILFNGDDEEVARGSGDFMKSRIPLSDIAAYANAL